MKKRSLFLNRLSQKLKTMVRCKENIPKNQGKSNFCCVKLELLLEKSYDTLIYLPATRTYLLKINDEVIYTLNYCPCCGKNLPEDLTDKLTYIVYQELALSGYEDHRLPPQFKSDMWWQKGPIPS